MPGAGKFRSFVTDIKKDFPTMDEYMQKHKNKRDVSNGAARRPNNTSKSPKRPHKKTIKAPEFKIDEDFNTHDRGEYAKMSQQYAREQEE